MNVIHRAVVACVASSMVAGFTQAAQPMKAEETSYESTTYSVSLPRSVPSRLSVRPCNACSADTLQLAATSAFYIGKEAVTYARFSDYAKGKSHGLTIHFTPETRVVTRLVASAR